MRVVVAVPGGNPADRACVTIARGLRDAGMEVVHAGPATLEQTADTVVQEDADAVGLPGLRDDAAEVLGRLAALLAERGLDDVVVFGCGPDAGLPDLPELTRLLPADTAPGEIAAWLRAEVGGAPGR